MNKLQRMPLETLLYHGVQPYTSCRSLYYYRVGTTLVSMVLIRFRRPTSTPWRTVAWYSTTTMCCPCVHLPVALSWQADTQCTQVRTQGRRRSQASISSLPARFAYPSFEKKEVGRFSETSKVYQTMRRHIPELLNYTITTEVWKFATRKETRDRAVYPPLWAPVRLFTLLLTPRDTRHGQSRDT